MGVIPSPQSRLGQELLCVGLDGLQVVGRGRPGLRQGYGADSASELGLR